VEAGNFVYRINIPGTGNKEYFLIEHRDRDWTDITGVKVNWDKHLFASGLAIWHIYDRVGSASPNWPFAPPDEGQSDSPSLPNKSQHSLVALIQPDRKLHLEKGLNRGDANDLWLTGQSFGDDASMIAGSRGYDKMPSRIALNNINLGDGTVV